MVSIEYSVSLGNIWKLACEDIDVDEKNDDVFLILLIAISLKGCKY